VHSLKTASLLVLALAGMPLVLSGQQEKTFPAPAVGVSSAGLRQTFANYWEWRLAESPELATRVGRTEHNDRWRDWSKAGRDRARAARQEFLQQVQYVSPGNMTASEHLSADLLEYELRTALETDESLDLVGRVSQVDGLHNQVFATIDQMPSRTVRDYESIVARLRALPGYIDQSIDLMREQIAAGLTQPAIVVNLMLDQVAAQAAAAPDESPLLASLARFPADISAADQNRLRAAARSAYSEQFVPSWKRLESFLRDTYLAHARAQIGITSLPSGTGVYASLIRGYTTTRNDPRQIHELGLKEVARIEGEMGRVVREAGFTGTPAEYERGLRNEPAMRFASQGEMLSYARDVLSRVEPQLPRLFKRVPRMAVGVRPIPPDREASTASNYTAGTADGARQGWFNMNTFRPLDQSKYTIDALVLHESVPGHHLQVGLSRELEGLPEFRRVFGPSAFTEGWALYAESLGVEVGVYREPASRFGRLASEQFRAVRLVVDTGMHAIGWSRAQARAYFAEHVPAQSLAEIDRYIARPAQALAYKLGELEIKRLRRKAEEVLGSRFDIREFHEAILSNGALPLDLLEPQIDAYIAAAKPAE
jgi:uncharacterized protein (DUF885 family)